MDNLQSITISQCFTNKCYIYCIHIVLLYIDNCLCFYYTLCIDDCQCLFLWFTKFHHPLLEVYAHDFRNNKSQKKTPAASDRCSTINYLFFIKTNTEFLNSNSPNLNLHSAHIKYINSFTCKLCCANSSNIINIFRKFSSTGIHSSKTA